MYCKLAFGNVKKSMRDYGVYFLTLAFGVCVFYAFNSIAQQEAVLSLGAIQHKVMELLSSLIGGVSVFIAVVLGFLIVYASRFLIRRRKNEFGTYLLLGMPTAKVSRVIVYETLFVGGISLVAGLLLGVVVSQVFLYVTAALFEVPMDSFLFLFSPQACVMTLVCFCVIFLIALIFNTVSVARYKLLDLMQAARISEKVKLRNIPLSVVLFCISLILIGAAYYLLLDNGLYELNEQFAASTVLVCVGTALFFYSLAGFLLRMVQSRKSLYLRNLNMFTLRQLNAKINTAFVSITVVCITLFLAITSSCGGFALCTSFSKGVREATVYDASFCTYAGEVLHINSKPDPAAPWFEAAERDNYDMAAALSREIEGWDEMVAASAQVECYLSDVSFRDIAAAAGFFSENTGSLGETSGENASASLAQMLSGEMSPLDCTPLSSYNALRELRGLDPLQLQDNECFFWLDTEMTKVLFERYAEQHESLEVFGRELKLAALPLDMMLRETSASTQNPGSLVVPDEMIPQDAQLAWMILNVNYNGERSEVEPRMHAALETYTAVAGWPSGMHITAMEVINQNTALTASITYLALYIGFVLLVACAAILSLQQLSEAADNSARYGLLEKLGVERTMMNRALLMQIAIYFVFPLIVALAHSLVALDVVVDVAEVVARLSILEPLLMTLLLFTLVYGGYFLITYYASKVMIHQRLRS